jgi:hypothetical protein
MSGPQRIRRPIAARTKDFLQREYPLDKVGDDRIGQILSELTNELDRRTADQNGVAR